MTLHARAKTALRTIRGSYDGMALIRALAKVCDRQDLNPDGWRPADLLEYGGLQGWVLPPEPDDPRQLYRITTYERDDAMTPIPSHTPAANDPPPLDVPNPVPVRRSRRVVQVQRVWTPFKPVPRRRRAVPKPVDKVKAGLLLLGILATLYGFGMAVLSWLW